MENSPTKIEYELDNSTREKMSQKKTGAMNPNFGKPRDVNTVKKISNSMRKHHETKKAFEEATKMSATQRVWIKMRFQGLMYYKLVKFNDVCAIYIGKELGSKPSSEVYRVYKYKDDVLSIKDFETLESAESLYSESENPNIQFIFNETRNKVVVLGFMKEDN